MTGIPEFLDALQDAFLGDDISQISKFVTTPLVVYSLAGVVVLRTEEQLLKIALEYRDALNAQGITTTETAIIEQDAIQNQRCRITVRFRNLAEDGAFVGSSVVRYFLLQQNGSYVVEMLEYIEVPIPPETVERIVH